MTQKKRTTNPRKLFHEEAWFKTQFGNKLFDTTKDKRHKGDINEYEIAIQHMRKGCKVYKNMGSTGHMDMIIEFPNGKLLKIDSKQLSSKQNRMIKSQYLKIGLGRKPIQKLLNVRYIAVRGRKLYYVHHTK